MPLSPDLVPAGVDPLDGVIHFRSDAGVEDTVSALRGAIEGLGAKVFSVIDQAAEAAASGLELRPTYLILFGNPRAGTPVMERTPLAALDLPLKLLVWRAQDDQTWVSCLSGNWLVARYGILEEFAAVLSAPENLARRITTPDRS